MDIVDLFDREQRIYDNAVKHLDKVKADGSCCVEDYGRIIKEYGRILKQLRRVTKISDRTTVNLNESKLDLLDKVHYDALTGIYNRRYLEENLSRVIKSLSRSGGLLSVIMIDIDYFKRYNDTYGHSMGDDCLKSVAAALNGCVTRVDDFVARYGGEEFIIILPNTDICGARIIASRALESVRECKIPHEQSDASDHVTISLGIASGTVKHSQNAADYVIKADEALYMSKQGGRNRYTFLEFQEE